MGHCCGFSAFHGIECGVTSKPIFYYKHMVTSLGTRFNGKQIRPNNVKRKGGFLQYNGDLLSFMCFIYFCYISSYQRSCTKVLKTCPHPFCPWMSTFVITMTVLHHLLDHGLGNDQLTYPLTIDYKLLSMPSLPRKLRFLQLNQQGIFRKQRFLFSHVAHF